MVYYFDISALFFDIQNLNESNLNKEIIVTIKTESLACCNNTDINTVFHIVCSIPDPFSKVSNGPVTVKFQHYILNTQTMKKT